MDTLPDRLAEARDQNLLVRLERSCAPSHADGFIVAQGPVWGILQAVDDSGRYAGFEAFRRQDVGTLTAPSPRAAFLGKVLARRGSERPAPPELVLDDLGSLLDGLSWDFPLLTLHREIADPEARHHGAVVYYSDEVVGLREIDGDANWREAATEYPVGEITRVEFGGPYQEALALAADEE